jgi:hypothetical protein
MFWVWGDCAAAALNINMMQEPMVRRNIMALSFCVGLGMPILRGLVYPNVGRFIM